MEGILRRVSKGTWKGKLHGYEILVCCIGGQWDLAAFNLAGGFTETVQAAASLRDAARQARAWGEWRVGQGRDGQG